LGQRIFEKVASHEANRAALPILRAATEIDAAPGSYYAPSGRFQMTGHPRPIAIPKPARNQAAAAKLWEIAESLTGVKFSR
jgi:hypothetical protein